jgi:hypothetical protein
MEQVEAVAFQWLDQCLATAPLGHDPAVRGSHQPQANQLRTVREIVARI